MYHVEIGEVAANQLADLPRLLQDRLLDVLDHQISVEPSRGARYGSDPGSRLRTWTFGENDAALAIYQVDDDRNRIVLLRIVWSG